MLNNKLLLLLIFYKKELCDLSSINENNTINIKII